MKKVKKQILLTKALVVEKNHNNFNFSIKKIPLKKLRKDDVIIQTHYTSINYKDYLITKGNPGLVRSYPHVPGIDCTGKVYLSNSKKFKKGDKVMVIAKPIGITSYGTFSNYFICASKWIEKLPKKINLKTPVIFGTAGFSAMLATQEIIKLKLNKKLPILVTGSTGGVGIMSLFFLNNLGFKIIAATTNVKKNGDLLKRIGAAEVIDYSSFNKNIDLPLLKKKYLAIIDNIGGNILSSGLKELYPGGAIVSVGNVISNQARLNIIPFLLRGVKIIGINADSSSSKIRKKIWSAIYKKQNSKKIKFLFKVFNFDNIVHVLKNGIKNNYFGRLVIKMK